MNMNTQKKPLWNDVHIIHTFKTLLRAFYFTSGTFVLLFVSFHLGGVFYTFHLESKVEKAFNFGLGRDLSYLKEQGDLVAENKLVQDYIISEDSTNLLSVLQEEKNNRSIGLMGATNKEGIIISRTKTVGRKGDNSFLNTPQGRVVAEGKSVQSVELTTFAPNQLLLTTGRPVVRDGLMVGALFANYLTDDDYATRFRDTYLPKGTEIFFYTKRAGVYGDSFSDPKKSSLINSYFNSGSNWIRNGYSGKTVVIDDSFYLAKNILLYGLEGSQGGAIIFIPRLELSVMINLLTSLTVLLVFVFMALRHHFSSSRELKGWRYYALLVCMALPVFGLAFFALYAQNSGRIKLERIPYTLYNSTLRFQPDSGVFSTDFEQRFSIIADTGDESINAVQISLKFEPDMINDLFIDVATSTCSYVIENRVDARAGTADLSCVILNSRDGQRSLPIADVVFVPKHRGLINFSFEKEGTKVLANDGLGTNVLRSAEGGSYIIENFNELGRGDLSNASSTEHVVVFSPTHPNQGRWYNFATSRFFWRGKPDTVYQYSFDTNPDSIPDAKHTIQDSPVEIPIPGDGIFYFHLRKVSGGATTHYRIKSDLTAPRILSMRLSSDKIKVGDVVRFAFEADDVGSGIQRNYYVDLGNHLFLPVGDQLFVPFLETGNQKIILRVYDDAGNYTEKTQIVQVEDSGR